MGRETAVKVLYSLEFNAVEAPTPLPAYWPGFLEISEEVFGFARDLVDGVRSHWEEVNAHISETSRRWKIDRMAVIDRNILRLATYEILFREDIPAKVSINEAIEIAKTFGSQDSPAFVNGILDRIAENSGRLVRPSA
jgi:transcription antitermination protein NusB